jgi:O-antigen/teichoic acid export membrane protein
LTVSRLPERTVLAGFTPVLQPAFSKHAREGKDLSQGFLLGVEHVTVLLWPALLGIILLAHPLVMILLGSQWTATVPIVQIIAMSFLVWFPMNLPRPALVAVGAVRETALIAVLTVPVVVGVQIAASFHGLQAVAWSFVIANIYSVAVSMYFVRRHITLPWSQILRSLRKSALVTMISALPLLLMVVWAGGTELVSIPQGITAAVISAAWWFWAIHWLSHPIKDEIARALDSVRSATNLSSILRNPKSIKAEISSRVFDGRKSG